MIALFLHMSDDFILFVQSYQNGDDIAVLQGCDWILSVWLANGQHKYVAAYHEQLDHLLIKHIYQRYVEDFFNWMISTHPSSTGKGKTSQDEYLELGNRLFSVIPKMMTLKGMARVGNFVGLSQRCKRFCQKFYTKSAIYSTRKVTASGGHANQTPERKAIYELYSLLHMLCGVRRKLDIKSVQQMVSKVKTDLQNQKLEDKMNNIKQCYASCLFNGVTNWYNDKTK